MSEEGTAPAPPRAPLALRVRLGRILWRLLPWGGVAAFAVVAAWLFGASPPALGQVGVGALVLLAYGLVLALLTELLSPDRSDLRLLPLSDGRATRIAAALRFVLLFLLLTEVGAQLLEANRWHPGLADLLRILRNVVLLVAATSLLSASGLPRRLKSWAPDTIRGSLARFLVRVILPLAFLALLFVLVAFGLGYGPLAGYVAGNALWTALKLLVAVLAYRWLRRLLVDAVRFYRADTEPRGEAQKDGPRPDIVGLGLERLGSGLLRLVVAGAAILWVLSEWDLPPRAILTALSTPAVGETGPTWGQTLGGFAKVAVVLFAGWLLRTLLTYFVFPGSRVGVGGRYAILAVLRYVVIAVAAVFALDALGVDTSSLGWFFGAAGIGIGLGLQDIIGNFISGLIMLVERPIRVGDVVQVGDSVGTVEDIKIRGTTMRTFDNMTILIPNRQMLGERVTNRTHAMKYARCRVDVGVSYGSEPEAVKATLLEAAAANAEVLREPEPAVAFQGYGASSLDFTLFCHTDQVRSHLRVASDLRYDIFRRFKARGIEIPFPQQDLHLKTGWPPVGAPP